LILLYTLALAEDHSGQTNSALDHYQKVLSLFPRDEDVFKKYWFNLSLKWES